MGGHRHPQPGASRSGLPQIGLPGSAAAGPVEVLAHLRFLRIVPDCQRRPCSVGGFQICSDTAHLYPCHSLAGCSLAARVEVDSPERCPGGAWSAALGPTLSVGFLFWSHCSVDPDWLTVSLQTSRSGWVPELAHRGPHSPSPERRPWLLLRFVRGVHLPAGHGSSRWWTFAVRPGEVPKSGPAPLPMARGQVSAASGPPPPHGPGQSVALGPVESSVLVEHPELDARSALPGWGLLPSAWYQWGVAGPHLVVPSGAEDSGGCHARELLPASHICNHIPSSPGESSAPGPLPVSRNHRPRDLVPASDLWPGTSPVGVSDPGGPRRDPCPGRHGPVVVHSCQTHDSGIWSRPGY